MAVCCGKTRHPGDNPSRVLAARHRAARAVFGIGFLLLALRSVALPAVVGVQLLVVAGWFGLSHLAAAVTGYPDCPELGAIASVLLRRYVPTRCGPWERFDAAVDRLLIDERKPL